MSDKLIEKREFVRHFSRYLADGGVYCLTVRGEVRHRVEITSDRLEEAVTATGTVCRQPESDMKESVYEQPLDVVGGGSCKISFKRKPIKYGCGCDRNDCREILCKKHGRF